MATSIQQEHEQEIHESKQLIDLLSSRSPFGHALIRECMPVDQW